MADITYSEHEIQSTRTRIVLSVWEPHQPEVVIVFTPATMVHPLMYEPLLAECGNICARALVPAGYHYGRKPRGLSHRGHCGGG